MSSKKSFTDNELSNTVRIALLFGFRMLGLFMIFPILTVDVSLNFSTTPMLIGIALGIYGLTQASLQIPFGLLSDKYGRKKIIIIGLLFFIIGSLLAATAESMWQLIIGRALQGCGAIASVLLAYLADLTKATVRIRAMASVGMSIGLSFILSLILGPILHQWIGLQGIFYGTAILGCFGFLLLLTIKDKQHSNHQAIEYQLSFSAMQSVWRIQSLWSLNFTVLSIHACITIIFLFIPTLLIQHGLNLSSHWQIYLLTMLTSLIIAIPMIIYTEKKQKIRYSLLISLTLLSLAFIIFFQYNSFTYLIVALILFFASFNVLEALLPSSVSRIAPVQYRGMALGIFSSHQFFGAFIGGTLGGIILNYFGIHGLLYLAIILVVISFNLFLWIPVDMQKRPQIFTINPHHPINKIEQWCKNQPGVLEVVYQQNSGVLYLKTDLNNFNEQVFHHNVKEFESHEVKK